jgi:hypothetical protein
MIVFNLVCANDHSFEGWFASAEDFEHQRQSALLSCPACSSIEISKGLHAPYVNVGSAPKIVERKLDAKPEAGVYAKAADGLLRLVEHVIANTEDVGDAFPEEARKIHYNEVPERKIRGNASHDEVKELREEGIEVIALPVPNYRAGKAH